MGDGSRGCTARGRPVAAEVNPGRGTGGWRSRGARRVACAPSRFKCSAQRKNGDGGHQWARQWVPVVEVVFAEQGGAEGEEDLDRWSAMMRGGPVGGYLVGSRLNATRCCVQRDVVVCILWRGWMPSIPPHEGIAESFHGLRPARRTPRSHGGEKIDTE